MNKKTKNIIALILNLAIFIFEVIGISLVLKTQGYIDFQYFTEDSNILMLCASLLTSCFIVLELTDKNAKMPKWVSMFKYMSTLSLALTFFTVVLILGKINGYKEFMIDGSMLFQHTVCPLLAMVSFCFFEKHEINSIKDTFIGLGFQIAYTIVILPLNIFKVIVGPYPFLEIYNNSILISIIWGVSILAGTYLMSFLLMKSNNHFNK